MYINFDLPLDTTSGAPPFVGRIAINNVAYSHTEQQVNPLETILGSVWSYGQECGRAIESTRSHEI